jgi:predicted ABC-type transport system involved in lysophospholipase L1 biosynthesis ATPase subunit
MIAGVGRRAGVVRARALLESFGLGARAGHLPGKLSGGEQQRVAIARALANAPGVLLADEPTGNLDVGTGRAVMDLLFALCAASGVTLFLITHDPALATRCGRNVTLRDGAIAA